MLREYTDEVWRIILFCSCIDPKASTTNLGGSCVASWSVPAGQHGWKSNWKVTAYIIYLKIKLLRKG